MAGFGVEPVNKPPDEHKFSIFSNFPCAKSHVKEYKDGIAEGYEIVCMENKGK